jgi:phosphogluconate dehydratase
MELSLFSRDVIALAAGVALSHDTFDAALHLGICDKIVPGLVMAAASFGHVPAIFVPAGPMPTGLPNDEKSRVRQRFATGEATRAELMAAEMASYHGPGTCTFYGTANTNQMLMEFMGLHLPGASFVNPGDPLREALTVAAAERSVAITALGNDYRPVADILDERAFVNGIVGLMATGAPPTWSSTIPPWPRRPASPGPSGLRRHLRARAADAKGLPQRPRRREPLPRRRRPPVHDRRAPRRGPPARGRSAPSRATASPLRARAAPPGRPPPLGRRPATERERPHPPPPHGPLPAPGRPRAARRQPRRAVIKVSPVAPERPGRRGSRPRLRIAGGREGRLQGPASSRSDCIVVVRHQGPKANGMPELHALTPTLSVLQDRGLKVALVTDGRMSGASGKVPAAIHVAPEAAEGGPLALLRDGDLLRLDAERGTLECLTDLSGRSPAPVDLCANEEGLGRELFAAFRRGVTAATDGASAIL